METTTSRLENVLTGFGLII